jgi:hypothetical protein
MAALFSRGGDYVISTTSGDTTANDGALNADVFRGMDRVVLVERTGPRHPSKYAETPE